MRVRYSIDNDNRLSITRDGQSSFVSGLFETDESNRLIYWLDANEKIIFAGKWKLNPAHELELQLEDTPGGKGKDVLRIRGEIISAEADRLVFEVKTSNEHGLTKLRLLKLSGVWHADEYNQLAFTVTKNDSPDILTLKGSWTINQNQQIVYSWQKTELKKKTRAVSTIEFSGFWEFSQANRLTYILSTATNSRFDFRAQMESPNLYPKEGVIKYRIGIGISRASRVKPEIISLYGAWKFSRNLTLSFDMEYAGGVVHSLQFGTEVDFGKNNRVVFNLLAKDSRRLGASVVFTHRFLKAHDAELFIRLKKLEGETGAVVGGRVHF